MSTLIVGFRGAAGSGKTTAVNHIVETFGKSLDVRPYAFADALKIEVFDWLQELDFLFEKGLVHSFVPSLPIPQWDIVHTDREKIAWVNDVKKVLRPFLQLHGTERRRAQDEDYWVDSLLERVAEDSPRVALIHDVRFPNEVWICHVTVEVRRNGQVILSTTESRHSSENALQNYTSDFVIQNNTDLEGLKRHAIATFNDILRKFRVQ